MELIVQNVCRNRKEFTLQDVSFTLPRGYILGVLGRNGSGKSTLFNTMIVGNLPDGGSIRIDDCFHTENDGKEDDKLQYRKQIAYVLENCPYPNELTPLEIMRMYGPFYDDFDTEKYLGLLKKFQVPEKRILSKLSKGMVIKVQIAFAFSYGSSVLVLDEPSANLDTFARQDLYQMIYEYMDNGDRNIIWATHLTDELDRMADYLLMLDKGKQLFFDTKDELLQQYTIIKGNKRQLDCMRSQLISRTDHATYSEGMAKTTDGPFRMVDDTSTPTIEQLLFYLFQEDSRRTERSYE